MDAFDDDVVGEDQRLAADRQHRRVVDQAARRRIEGKAAQGIDEGGLGAYRLTSPASASSSPFTNPVSRES